ncbi:putative EF-TU receptor [Hibiscus syriacus]|uniref:EF-TU receptor n=1 Tax=Hibiscus syriacus TaxID=106335 RepID=A0A6A2ZMS9_HIBSY|nr:protein PSK SIMULATOR 1-like [Hibiscus syriacus]KAE8692866.1 putative EF-TU receptor [Hibiscus syriacus]
MAWPTVEMEEVTAASYGCSMFRQEKPTLQILAFEAAKNMSVLVSLYKSLTHDEFLKLRNGPMKSPGVAFLNSTDETYLLGLACKEKLEDLNHIASVVSRLSKRCVDEELSRFETAYQNMKHGTTIDISNLDFNSKKAGKIIEKMETYASATSSLYTAMEDLKKLELYEKRKQRSRTNEKICFQRKHVRHLKQVSLWNKTFDKIVALMARIICTVYARICVVFEPFVPSLLSTTTVTTANCFSFRRLYVSHLKAFHMKKNNKQKASKSSPILSGVTMNNKSSNIKTNVNQRLIQSAPPNTVGAAGLTARYANIIVMTETYFYSTALITDAARKHMFEILPVNLKQTLRGKLRSHWYKVEREGKGLEEGWKEALEEIIRWLAPVAHDTLIWQQERNLEQQKLVAKPTVLLFQTLHFSDLEKTEAAIVELLVGLSCIYWYENRRR